MTQLQPAWAEGYLVSSRFGNEAYRCQIDRSDWHFDASMAASL